MKNFRKISDWECPQCNNKLQQTGGTFASKYTSLSISCEHEDCDFRACLLVPDNKNIKFELSVEEVESNN